MDLVRLELTAKGVDLDDPRNRPQLERDLPIQNRPQLHRRPALIGVRVVVIACRVAAGLELVNLAETAGDRAHLGLTVPLWDRIPGGG